MTEFSGTGGWKDDSDGLGISVSESGLLKQALHPKQGMTFRSSLIVQAAFGTSLCKQSASVLRTVGKKGQYLGNDCFAWFLVGLGG